MKMFIVAAALMIGAPAIAQSTSQPPGDGIDIHGHDPNGQAFTPPGYNNTVAAPAYAPMAAAPAGMIGGEYPICSAQNTDRCVQAYTKMTKMQMRTNKRRMRR